MERIDATPSVHLLHAMRNQNLGWWKALAELIDNSFDAGATRVVLSAKGRTVQIEDNGRGMSDVTCAVRLGDHRAGESPGLGMYGIGLKDAWLYADGSICVDSVRDGTRAKIFADIQQMIEHGSWMVDAPTVAEAPDAKSGTTITLGLARRRKLPTHSHVQELSWAFTPALKSGRQIEWQRGVAKPETLAAKELPPLLETVRDSFDVGGKSVSIEIGIVADGHHMTNGPVWIQYRHRNIMRSHIGMGSFNDERIGGIVRLGEGWSLTKNKDDFDANKDELGDAIHSRIRMLLLKAEQLSHDIESKEIACESETRVNEAIGELKREKRRQTREQSGTVKPGDSGRKRRKAKDITDQVGSVIAKDGNRRRGISLGFGYLEGDLMGEFDPSCNRITLNSGHPFISRTRKSKSTETLYVIAMSIFSHYVCNHDGNHLTLFEVRDFSQTLGAIMKSIHFDSEGAASA